MPKTLPRVICDRKSVLCYDHIIELNSGNLPSEAELRPAKKGKSRGDYDPEHDGSQTCSAERVYDRQQKEANANGQVPPSPVLRLESAHVTIVIQCDRFPASA